MEVAGSHPVKVSSPEMLSLSDRAQALCIAEGNTPRRENGECRGGARGRRPVHAAQDAVAVPGRSTTLSAGVCLYELKRRGGQKAWWKSDRCVVPMKPGNAGGGKAATPPERTGEAPAVLRDGDPVKLRLERIRRRARTHRTDSFNNLFSHLDAELLLWAFEGLEEGKAPGVDGIDVEEYGRGLEARLRSLLDRLHRGEYRPQPSRRRWIPKGDGRLRPLGIPATEDKLVQGMLTAGVMEEGSRVETEAGTPQGGVISPLLANIYLHYALDEWFAKVVKKGCQGEAYLVRYADDFVACFEYETDACRFRTALAVRLGRFKLEVEPTKTQMLRFGRFAKRDAQMRGERVAVFDFLGLTHYCGTSRTGRFKLKWRTSKRRFRVKLRAMRKWICSHPSLPLAELWRTVNRKLQGHYAYYHVSDNWTGVQQFRWRTLKALYWGLNRRSQRHSFTWREFVAYVGRYPLATPRRVVNLNPAPTV